MNFLIPIIIIIFVFCIPILNNFGLEYNDMGNYQIESDKDFFLILLDFFLSLNLSFFKTEKEYSSFLFDFTNKVILKSKLEIPTKKMFEEYLITINLSE